MKAISKKAVATAMALFLFLGAFLVATPASAASSRGADVIVIPPIDIDDTTPVIGDNINVSCNVRNVGDVNATSVTVTFEAIGASGTITFATFTVPAEFNNTTDREAWGIWNSTSHPPVPDEVYTINVTAVNATDDNTTNGTLTATSTVVWAAPMLVVDGIAASAGPYLIGDDVTITVTVLNDGSADFQGNQTVTLGYDGDTMDEYLDNTAGTPLAPAGTADVAFVVDTSGFSAGDVNFTCQLEGAGDFLVLTFEEKVSNVSVTDIAFSGVLKHTLPITITATLANADGTVDAIDHDVVFKQGTTTLCTVTLNVSIGATPTAECVWTPATSAVEATYTINVETEGGANVASEDVTVGPTPAAVLEATAISLSTIAAMPDVGDTQDVTVTVSVTNSGDADATPAVVELLVDGTVAATNDTVDISAGASVDLVFMYEATTAENDVELNFSVGDTFELATVPGDIDLAVLGIDSVTYASTVEQKDPLVITVVIANTGDADQVEEVTVDLMIGTTKIGSVAFENISAGGTNTTTYEWAVAMFATGKYQINATIVDGAYLLGENVSVTEYLYPDVTVEFATKDDGKLKNYKKTAAEGEKKKVKVEIVVTNDGNAAASGIYIQLFDKNNEEIGNTTVSSLAPGGNQTVEIEVTVKAGKSTGAMTVKGTYTFDGEEKVVQNTGEGATAKVEMTPGFELVVLLAAVIVAVVVLARRRK